MAINRRLEMKFSVFLQILQRGFFFKTNKNNMRNQKPSKLYVPMDYYKHILVCGESFFMSFI